MCDDLFQKIHVYTVPATKPQNAPPKTSMPSMPGPSQGCDLAGNIGRIIHFVITPLMAAHANGITISDLIADSRTRCDQFLLSNNGKSVAISSIWYEYLEGP